MYVLTPVFHYDRQFLWKLSFQLEGSNITENLFEEWKPNEDLRMRPN